MGNLVKIETKVVLDVDARKAIEEEIQTLRTVVTSAAHINIYKIINSCVNAAYRLGKIDAQREN